MLLSEANLVPRERRRIFSTSHEILAGLKYPDVEIPLKEFFQINLSQSHLLSYLSTPLTAFDVLGQPLNTQ
jgi:hypothetical protein